MVKPTFNRPPNAGRLHPSELQKTDHNVGGSKITIAQVIQSPSTPATPSSSVTVTAPLQMAGNAISIPQATGSQSGYLLAADWTTFNAKMTTPMTTLGDIIYGGSSGLPTRLPIGANTYVLTVAGGVPVWAAGGGGGSSPYTVPLLANFTVANTPAGATVADTSTGLTLFCPTNGLKLFALTDNTAPVGSFTLTAGFRVSALGSNAGIGIFVEDGTGKIASFGIDTSSANAANYDYWTDYNTFSANPLNTDNIDRAMFVSIVKSGTNFLVYSGADLNALLLISTFSATAFIGTPTLAGVYIFGLNQDIAATFFHYTLV